MSRVLKTFVNRNPRNLEQLGLQMRTAGYTLDVDRSKHQFIYRANFARYRRYVIGEIEHYKDGIVLSASSREKQISAQLYSPTDISACDNIGRVLGLRCAMSGIHFLQNVDFETIKRSTHTFAFYNALMESGVKFGEPSHIDHSFATDPNLTYENYELQHTKEDNLD